MSGEERPKEGGTEDRHDGLGFILRPLFYIGSGFALLAALFSTNSPAGAVASILTSILFVFLGRKVGTERKKSTVLLYMVIGFGLIALTYGLCVNDWHTFTYTSH